MALKGAQMKFAQSINSRTNYGAKELVLEIALFQSGNSSDDISRLRMSLICLTRRPANDGTHNRVMVLLIP